MKYIFLLLLSFNAFSFIDNEEKNEIKQQFWQNKQTILNINVDFYLNQIAKKVNTKKVDVKLFLIDDYNINAFATKYGYIGLNSGLVDKTDNEEELLATIAHEIAHIDLKHFARIEEKDNNLLMIGGLLLASQIKNQDAAEAIFHSSIASNIQQKINWTREYEVEADNYAKQVFISKHLNLSSMSSFFNKLEQNPNAIEYLQTHPLPFNRASNSYIVKKASKHK